MSEPEHAANSPRGLLGDDVTREFKPTVQWRLWIAIATAVTLFGLAYLLIERRRENALRTRLLREHAELTGSLSPRYRAVRAKVERLTMSAVAGYAGDFVAPGFTIDRLRAQPVLYGRVRAREIQRIEQVGASIRRRFDDQVGACAGLEIEKIWRFYDRGEFLMPSYVDAVRPASGVDRLRFLREDLLTRIRTDTPDLVRMSLRPLFVLVVDEGTSQIDGASRLYAWELDSERPLLRARAEGDETVIIPVRIGGMPGGGSPIPAPSGALTVTMHDCSLANRIKALLNVSTDGLRAPPEVPTPAETAAAAGDAGAIDGAMGVMPDATPSVRQ